MSQKRADLVQIRQDHFALVEKLRQLGDYDANAKHAGQMAETLLKLIEHLLERTK